MEKAPKRAARHRNKHHLLYPERVWQRIGPIGILLRGGFTIKIDRDIHKMLRDVMEEIGEYMNAHDIVQGVDVAINKTIYDLVYERKTEKDYENHD